MERPGDASPAIGTTVVTPQTRYRPTHVNPCLPPSAQSANTGYATVKGATLTPCDHKTDKILPSHVQPLPSNLTMTHAYYFSYLSQPPQIVLPDWRRA